MLEVLWLSSVLKIQDELPRQARSSTERDKDKLKGRGGVAQQHYLSEVADYSFKSTIKIFVTICIRPRPKIVLRW